MFQLGVRPAGLCPQLANQLLGSLFCTEIKHHGRDIWEVCQVVLLISLFTRCLHHSSCFLVRYRCVGSLLFIYYDKRDCQTPVADVTILNAGELIYGCKFTSHRKGILQHAVFKRKMAQPSISNGSVRRDTSCQENNTLNSNLSGFGCFQQASSYSCMLIVRLVHYSIL